MKHYFCNPINVPYKYQFNKDPRKKGMAICRESADPSLICFKGRYLIFSSMSLGFYHSLDLASWEYHPLPESLPLYDYAPDVRANGDYLYFCASRRDKKCDFYRTKDPFNGPFEKIKGSFPFWDPNLFFDDDGRVYFYHGCTNTDPLYGVELSPKTMAPISEQMPLIYGDPYAKGYERIGKNNSVLPASEAEIDRDYRAFMKRMRIPSFFIPKRLRKLIRGMFSHKPFIEGAWMNKIGGKYYLQYAAPGTQYNTYADGVYVSDHPLEGFQLASNNPFSYKPGGFIPGAGHGSTLVEENGIAWHVSTMSISVNHDFERRIGLWPAGKDESGDLYCNQRFGDYPYSIEELRVDPWAKPKWNLLSYGKKVTVSSTKEGTDPNHLVDENIATVWKAEEANDQFVEIDLGSVCSVHAIQINFADMGIDIPVPGKIHKGTQARYIEERALETKYRLSSSVDGKEFVTLSDKTDAKTDLSHDLFISEEGVEARYIRLSDMSVPYKQTPCLSGVRVFGINNKAELPVKAAFTINRIGETDVEINIAEPQGCGYNILFGESESKLYHCYQSYEPTMRIGALIQGRKYCFRVDTFNEAGIVEGDPIYE